MYYLKRDTLGFINLASYTIIKAIESRSGLFDFQPWISLLILLFLGLLCGKVTKYRSKAVYVPRPWALESESLGLISKLGHFPSYHFGQLILGS
jgi:hypothetical protein